MAEGMITRNIVLPVDLNRRLIRAAKTQGGPASAIIRDGIRGELRRIEVAKQDEEDRWHEDGIAYRNALKEDYGSAPEAAARALCTAEAPCCKSAQVINLPGGCVCQCHKRGW